MNNKSNISSHNDKSISIIVAGGGTGGHLMPAIALCEILKEEGYNPILLTDQRCKGYLPANLKFPVEISSLNRPSLSGIFYCIYDLALGVIRSFRISSKYKAKLVIACGGYTCAPLLVASILRITPFILQEQNAIIGKVNYYFGYFAKKLFISFIHTTNLPFIASKRIIWAPMPLLAKHTTIKAKKESQDDRFVILITGGSQGANIFDELITESILLTSQNLKSKTIKVIQQSATKGEEIAKKYKEAGIKCITEKFFHNIEEYYNEADLFIGRAGASTVNEIMQYQIPSILIPYPYAANNHQYYNAKNLEEFSAGWVVMQKDITSKKLSLLISEIIDSKELRRNASINLSNIRIDSKDIILNCIKKIIDKSN
ncbi:MAG: UDP-N-acetylglucosamine--N-acetylmuramyl-(pentapeptide) pyrophosphoryl-undecaprenol N-acetylglucosamine transferase [Rickettsiaceae bacterium]|nr:UDP-N-acetylglucosamine--N-acetylmuramyl-(pentapeptide) pyrophosphoryl-undecaprenol N-acetylglucosamine transferase [Rickettsiaceae bacterium]